VPRSDLVVGKWMAAVVFGLVALLLMLLFSFLVLGWTGQLSPSTPARMALIRPR
jgi:ABC-type transport system involved in multi-copper enzyme maturation permease subunit